MILSFSKMATMWSAVSCPRPNCKLHGSVRHSLHCLRSPLFFVGWTYKIGYDFLCVHVTHRQEAETHVLYQTFRVLCPAAHVCGL